MKNLSASIQAKLKNLSKSENLDFVLISRLYMQEGFLRRLAESQYNDSFYLKGGLLLFSISGFKSRPTQDIDLLGFDVSSDETQLLNTLREIFQIDADDCLIFHTDTIQLEAITEGADYHGQRIKIVCTLGNIKTNLKLDIGFGDIVYPGPVEMIYPSLLNTDSFKIKAYSLESVIAEKFEAMIVLDERNSRMKDFYDVYDLLSTHKFQDNSLFEAIKQTMHRRNTTMPANPSIFKADFPNEERNIKLWSAYLKRIRAKEISFTDVMSIIQTNLNPIYEKLLKEIKNNHSGT